MKANKWSGVGDYDVLLTLSEQEMRKLAQYYHVDWSFFTTGPSKSFDGKFFCFASYSRKKLALLPFLSIAFGGMHDELPIGDAEGPAALDYGDFSLEKFSFR